MCEEKLRDWLESYPGEVLCVRQIWYECFEGCGVPAAETVAEIERALLAMKDWEPAGVVRYEKMGPQPSFKRRSTPKTEAEGHIMVQHRFKVGGCYRAPDGRVLKVVLSEVYNLRCFELRDGSMVGGMVKIHPCSALAKSLVEVV